MRSLEYQRSISSGTATERVKRRRTIISATKNPFEIARDVADDVAFKSGRPWRVEDLRKRALEACRTTESSIASLGLPDEQASALMRRLIYKQVFKAAKGMDALPPGQEKAASERIEAALRTFTVEQWRILLEGFRQVDVEALLSFIWQEADGLKQRLGAWKVGCIEERAYMRDTDLWLENNRSKLVAITDPYWASEWREQASQANRVGKGHTATGRSIAELNSASSIARRLTKRDEQTGYEMKVDDREVKRWLERMESLPFEQYAADVEADDPEKRAAAFVDSYTTIRKKYQRKN